MFLLNTRIGLKIRQATMIVVSVPMIAHTVERSFVTVFTLMQVSGDDMASTVGMYWGIDVSMIWL